MNFFPCVIIVNLYCLKLHAIFFMDTRIIDDQPVSCKIRACPQCNYLVIDRDRNDCVICYCSRLPKDLIEWGAPFEAIRHHPPLIYFVPDKFKNIYFPLHRPHIYKFHKINGKIFDKNGLRKYFHTRGPKTIINIINGITVSSPNNLISTISTVNHVNINSSSKISNISDVNKIGDIDDKNTIPLDPNLILNAKNKINPNKYSYTNFTRWSGLWFNIKEPSANLMSSNNFTTQTHLNDEDYDGSNFFPRFDPDLHEYAIKPGEVVRVNCTPPIHLNESIGLTFLVKGLTLNDYQIQRNTIEIRNKDEWKQSSAKLTCQIRSNFLMAAIEMRLWLLQSPQIQIVGPGPKIQRHNIIFMERGQSIRLLCYVPGDLKALIIWESKSNRSNNQYLEISNVSCPDSGIHLCHASYPLSGSAIGRSQTIAHIIISVQECPLQLDNGRVEEMVANREHLFPFLLAVIVVMGILGVSVLACILFWVNKNTTRPQKPGLTAVRWLKRDSPNQDTKTPQESFIMMPEYMGTRPTQNKPPSSTPNRDIPDTSFSETPPGFQKTTNRAKNNNTPFKRLIRSVTNSPDMQQNTPNLPIQKIMQKILKTNLQKSNKNESVQELENNQGSPIYKFTPLRDVETTTDFSNHELWDYSDISSIKSPFIKTEIQSPSQFEVKESLNEHESKNDSIEVVKASPKITFMSGVEIKLQPLPMATNFEPVVPSLAFQPIRSQVTVKEFNTSEVNEIPIISYTLLAQPLDCAYKIKLFEKINVEIIKVPVNICLRGFKPQPVYNDYIANYKALDDFEDVEKWSELNSSSICLGDDHKLLENPSTNSNLFKPKVEFSNIEIKTLDELSLTYNTNNSGKSEYNIQCTEMDPESLEDSSGSASESQVNKVEDFQNSKTPDFSYEEYEKAKGDAIKRDLASAIAVAYHHEILRKSL